MTSDFAIDTSKGIENSTEQIHLAHKAADRDKKTQKFSTLLLNLDSFLSCIFLAPQIVFTF